MTHSYKDNDPRGWGGDPCRGAALGRPAITQSAEAAPKLYISRQRLDKGGYDRLSTYWGTPDDLYWVHDAEGEVDFCVRGDSRYEAQQAALKVQPKATFIRPAAAPYVRDVLAQHAARAFFVDAWASIMEEFGGGIPAGSELYEIAPPTPRSVLKEYGYKFIDEVCTKNGCTPGELWVAAREKEGEKHYRGATLDDLGFCLAMQASGSGVSWTDNHPPLMIRGKELTVPYWDSSNPFYDCNISNTLPAKVRRAWEKGNSNG